jgi:hypothetical protein
MALVEDTNLRGRARLPVVVAVVLTALAATTASARRMDQPGAGTPSQCSVFMLDRGRYTTVDLPARPTTSRAPSTTAVRSRASSSIPTGAFTASYATSGTDAPESTFQVPLAPPFRPQRPRRGRGRVQRHRSASTVRGRPAGLPARCARPIHQAALPGSVNTQAFGINNRGQVVGEYLDCAGTLSRVPVGEGAVHHDRQAGRCRGERPQHQRQGRGRGRLH